MKKLSKDMKSMKKASFTQLQQMKEDDSNDVSDSDTSEGESHFQFADGTFQFQFTQVKNAFKPQIAKLFKQSHGTSRIKLNLKEIILWDSQSTMDLFCNPALVKKSFKIQRQHGSKK